jgi:putative membrane protein
MAAARSWLSHERYPRLLLVLLALVSILLAIAPHDRADWLLENSLLFGGVAVLVATHRALPLSRISYTLVFLFLCLHAVGAHYTYSLVPYDAWFEALTGRTLSSLTGWERNHFDRLVHFLYGLLLAYPAREVFLRVADVRGFWGYYLPLDVVMATSVLYELIEWGAAAAFGGDLGVAYLGTQGDLWDAQKDMALAALGAVIAMLTTAAINWRYQRDFAREWAESLRVKRPRPLGEDALARRARKSGRSSRS